MMKRWLCAMGLMLASSALLGVIQSYDNVCVRNGRLELSPAASGGVSDDFTKDSGKWKPFVNFENKIRFDYTADGLRLTNGMGKNCDTAWTISSKPVAIPAGTNQYTVRVAARSAQNLLNIETPSTYANVITWLDELDQPISSGSTFKFTSSADFPAVSTIIGVVPRRARKAVLSIGADVPNIFVGVPVVIQHLSLAFTDCSKNAYEKEGTFIAGPFEPQENIPNSEKVLTWEADTPAGTGIRFQFAPATSDGKLAFIGPDGTADSWYDTSTQDGTKEGRLPQAIQFANAYYIKAVLTGNGTATPSVKSMTIIKKSVNPFRARSSCRDVVTAEVTLKSPARSVSMTEPVILTITDDVPVLWDKMTVKLDDADVTAQVQRNGNDIACLPKSGKFEAGVHEALIRLTNASGGTNQFRRLFYRGTEEVPEDCRVSLRDDGMTLIGGKPFFPIGIYAVCKREFNGENFDKAFADLKANGFNTAHTYGATYGPDGEQLLDAADKYGFKLYLSRGPLADMAKRMMRKCFLSWYIGDDTASHQLPEDLYQNHANLKAIDPWHVTCQADGIGGFESSRYRPYIHGTDVFLPEIYPVHEDTEQTKVKCVPQVITDMKTFWNDLKVTNEKLAKLGKPAVVKSCWSIIQHFKGWSWERFPTERELRAMSYASIAAGAHGITWYTYGGFVRPKENMYNYGITSSPEVWKQITTITRELNRLQDVLCERTVASPKMALLAGPAKDALGNDSLTILAKRHGGKTYVLAVNSTLKTVKAAFEPETPAAVRDWFADKNVAPAGTRRFEADFAPYGVRLFVLE